MVSLKTKYSLILLYYSSCIFSSTEVTHEGQMFNLRLVVGLDDAIVTHLHGKQEILALSTGTEKKISLEIFIKVPV